MKGRARPFNPTRAFPQAAGRSSHGTRCTLMLERDWDMAVAPFQGLGCWLGCVPGPALAALAPAQAVTCRAFGPKNRRGANVRWEVSLASDLQGPRLFTSAPPLAGEWIE